MGHFGETVDANMEAPEQPREPCPWGTYPWPPVLGLRAGGRDLARPGLLIQLGAGCGSSGYRTQLSPSESRHVTCGPACLCQCWPLFSCHHCSRSLGTFVTCFLRVPVPLPWYSVPFSSWSVSHSHCECLSPSVSLSVWVKRPPPLLSLHVPPTLSQCPLLPISVPSLWVFVASFWAPSGSLSLGLCPPLWGSIFPLILYPAKSLSASLSSPRVPPFPSLCP